jgi:hypothetical protein
MADALWAGTGRAWGSARGTRTRRHVGPVKRGLDLAGSSLGLLALCEPPVDGTLGYRSFHRTECLFVIGDAGLRGVWSRSGPGRPRMSVG